MKKIFLFLLLLSSVQVWGKQRVIAQYRTVLTFTGWQSDSILFRYSGSRGSVFDYSLLGYNETFFNVSYVPMPYMPLSEEPLNLLADTIHNFVKDRTTGMWNTLETWTAFYRPDNKMDSSYRTGIYEKRLYTYDASGNLTDIHMSNSSDEGEHYSPRTWQKIVYNGSLTRVLQDTLLWYSSGTWVDPSTKQYTYNTNGQIDSIHLFYTMVGVPYVLGEARTYFPDGKLQRVRYLRNAASSNDLEQTQFSYTPGISYATYREQLFSFPDGTPKSRTRSTWYPGPAGKPDSVVVERQTPPFATWEKNRVHRLQYNSEGNPETLLTFVPASDLLPAHTDTVRYDYEDYVGLSLTVPETEKRLNIFPNPNQGDLYINWSGVGQVLTITLLDPGGRMVFERKARLQPGVNKLRLPGIAAGHYLVLATDAKGSCWHEKLVIQ